MTWLDLTWLSVHHIIDHISLSIQCLANLRLEVGISFWSFLFDMLLGRNTHRENNFIFRPNDWEIISCVYSLSCSVLFFSAEAPPTIPTALHHYRLWSSIDYCMLLCNHSNGLLLKDSVFNFLNNVSWKKWTPKRSRIVSFFHRTPWDIIWRGFGDDSAALRMSCGI